MQLARNRKGAPTINDTWYFQRLRQLLPSRVLTVRLMLGYCFFHILNSSLKDSATLSQATCLSLAMGVPS